MNPLILAHRGYWKEPVEKNTLKAFQRAFASGWGVETDVRDGHDGLVVSHDPATPDALRADVFFEEYRRIGKDLPLALNIKADGIQKMLKGMLEEYRVENYFVFDMSVPDALLYHRQGLRLFTRQSEIEPEPCLYDEAEGVWLDCFYRDWITEALMQRHLEQGKVLCLVSPELHGRPYEDYWGKLAKIEISSGSRIMLCTDHPEKAEGFFPS